MLKKFYPSTHVKSVFSINYLKLFSMGYRGLIFDIDNTLVHHGSDSNDKIDLLFNHIHSLGFKTVLLTNNNKPRVERFIKNINTQYVCDANKPNVSRYFRALSILKLKRNEAIVIGDQLFTDIWGANRCGIKNILVDFIRMPNETSFGKKRRLERIILYFYARSKFAINNLNDIKTNEELNYVLEKR